MVALLLDPKIKELGTSQVILENLKEHLDFQKSIPGDQTTDRLTPSEIQTSKLYCTLAQMLCDISGSEKVTSPGFTDAIALSFKSLFDTLQGHLAILEKMQNIIPAPQPVLHAIYTAHEAGRTAVQFFWYFSRLRKEIWSKHEDNKIKLSRIAHSLLRAVADKTSMIKMGMDEGGWIDKVLEAVLPEPSERADQSKFMVEIVEAMKDLIDENFMEEWAGEVVESWRESVVGFALLKESV
jgi:N-terminal acetyltransferase B complex non-catalytic subunit